MDHLDPYDNNNDNTTDNNIDIKHSHGQPSSARSSNYSLSSYGFDYDDQSRPHSFNDNSPSAVTRLHVSSSPSRGRQSQGPNEHTTTLIKSVLSSSDATATSQSRFSQASQRLSNNFIASKPLSSHNGPSLPQHRLSYSTLNDTFESSIGNVPPRVVLRPSSLPSPVKKSPALLDWQSRPVSVSSPSSRHQFDTQLPEQSQSSPVFSPRDLDRFPHGTSPFLPSDPFDQTDARAYISQKANTYDQSTFLYVEDASRPRTERSNTSFHTARSSIHESLSDTEGLEAEEEGAGLSSSTLTAHPLAMSPKITPVSQPNLSLQVSNGQVGEHAPPSPNDSIARPKSPAGKFSFFGWNKAQKTESPSTAFSDSRSVSPVPSPHLLPMDSARRPSSPRGTASPYSSGGSTYSIPYATDVVSHVDELLKELHAVSAELAASIRREMELEDEVDRCKTEAPMMAPEPPGRRTSDYYSDSGTSSARYPPADSETKIEGLEKMRRKAEQEKAQLRLDMTQKIQDDLNQRRALEMHVHSLEEQLQSRNSAVYTSDERKGLQASLDDTKRRLSEERQFKQNFEDLIKGMREELEAYRNERDNLREEIVPQLKARVEGLEADAADKQTLTYENTRMQQELQSLKNENQTLVNARKLQLDMHAAHGRFKTISEDHEPPGSPGSPRNSLSRTGSLARSQSTRHRSGSLTRNVIKEVASTEHGDVKDLEEQRDALHRTLKALILRQDKLIKAHEKQIKDFESERLQGLGARSGRGPFNTNVQSLRNEINHLRGRADDAVELKWQCEKGLSGLKMDLDRARQETASLREPLLENDNFASDRPSSSHSASSNGLSEEPLDNIYADLKKQNGAEASNPAWLSMAEERIESNQQLRRRLAGAIEKGVREQESAAIMINTLQDGLRQAEDKMTAAQQVSEDSLAQLEQHTRTVREAKIEKDLRGVIGAKRAGKSMNGRPVDSKMPRNSVHSLKSPSQAVFGLRSPKLAKTSSGLAASITEASGAEAFDRAVRDLEHEARRADQEMEKVIEAMNRAQMEVAELQAQRDEASKETRHLQREAMAIRRST